MTQDLIGSRARDTAEAAMEDSLARAESAASRHAFVRTSFELARSVARAVDAVHACGGPVPPLAGRAVSVKDLFDVCGEVTAAGSTLLARQPPAQRDCPAVERLRRSGAAFVGRTNMSEFAYSGVGINPHFGTPANPVTAVLDPQPRIPGGSTSGGAVSVATGAAWAALGSDTGGSIRIPAALQGLVGFKNTARLTPTQGAVPLSTTLDTVCAITRSVRDAALLFEILGDRALGLRARDPATLRLAVPTTLMLDALQPEVQGAFERTLHTLRTAGAQVVELALPELAEVAAINATGGFSAAEAWTWHRERLRQFEAAYDPRVALRIRRGERMDAADYVELLARRRDWIERMERALWPFDALLSPTVPLLAPPLAPLLTDDDAFFSTNAMLLRNPSVVNLLDGCALSLPCHAGGEWPVGLMVWGTALRDSAVLEVSATIESLLQRGTR